MMRGWVYVLSNKAMPGLLKIGYSTKNPFLRARELSTTGVPHPFVVEHHTYVVEPRNVEQQVHSTLKHRREGKEFFRVSLAEAIVYIADAIHSQCKTMQLDTSSSQRPVPSNACQSNTVSGKQVPDSQCVWCKGINTVVRLNKPGTYKYHCTICKKFANAYLPAKISPSRAQ